MKPTFKNNYPTGPYRSFSHTRADIKLGGKLVGSIQYMENRRGYGVILHIKDIESAGGWKNIVLAKKIEGWGDTPLNEFKVWLKEGWERLSSKYEFHLLEP